MNTPICDFVSSYVRDTRGRFHMPGHKGRGSLGFEKYDITEITGADSLFEASGIIRESEKNASALFGCNTFYSAEGSSLAIRAMLYLAVRGKQKPLILAGRNAHRAFMYSSVLLGFDIAWLRTESAISGRTDMGELEEKLKELRPAAVYITSPDYLGNMADIASISSICRRYGALLLVDNAHGAYLRFLSPSRHPMDLGADMCASSAHKTLPVLTGGAYLQVKDEYVPFAKQALELFSSTSPSYLILQSLDAANPVLERLKDELEAFIPKAERLREKLKSAGFTLAGDETLKLTIIAKRYGYYGRELAALVELKGLFTEFSDPDYLVLMLSPSNTDEELALLSDALMGIEKRTEITDAAPGALMAERVMSAREAMLSAAEIIPVEKAAGRVLASACVGCPPAVPIVCAGERIDIEAVRAFEYYGISEVTVTV